MRELRPCGTEGAYQRHLKHGEVPCEPCTEARRAAVLRAVTKLKARRAAGIPARTLAPCGTPGAYQRHLRRKEDCAECRDAVRVVVLNRRNAKKFGMTPEQYDALLQSQGARCAICRTDSPQRGWAIDHDHSCCPGKSSCGRCVRGLLCGLCNRGLGHFHDDTDRLEAAIRYLRNGPAKLLAA